MPGWLVALFALAGGTLTLVGVYKGLIKPMAKFITTADTMLPMMAQLTATFARTPHVFEVLNEIVGQVRTDSGSSLLDIVKRLDEAAIENRVAAQLLRVSAEAAKELAAVDRQRIDRLLVLLDRLDVKVEAGGASLKRIEGDQAHVAADLVAAKAKVEGVATDLAATHQRADESTGTESGDAADAGARSPQEPK